MCNYARFALLLLVVGWYASLVCCGMSRKCQERCDHVCLVRPRDPAGDWHQQPTSQAEAAPGHSGDGQPYKHQPISTKNVTHCKQSVILSYLRFVSYLLNIGLLFLSLII